MAYTYEPRDLAGTSIVLTGGTKGIGRATAYRLLQAGANVLITGRGEQEMQDALQDFQSLQGKVYSVVADMSKPEDVKRVFAEADSQMGGVDILINNAALAANSILDTEFEDWQSVIHTNLIGYMLCCREAIDRMKPKGDGHIVNIGSLSAKVREAGSDVYVATKSGIEGFSESLRLQVNEQGIRISLIEPGLVGTDMTVDQVPKEQQPQQQEKQEMLKAEDIAECVYYTLTQPTRCDVIMVQIRPRKQII